MSESKKLVRSSAGGITIGTAGLGAARGDKVGTVKQNVHDGDTVFVRALANVSIRFLAIDSAELTYSLPGTNTFKNTDDPAWKAFLTDPFANWPNATQKLGQPLLHYLEPKLGASTAENHFAHAKAAKEELQRAVQKDVNDYASGDIATYELFLRFARDVLDRYGRLLAYINVSLPKGTPRPPTYNERQLQAGAALPYFIWPNVDPFKKQPDLLDAVPKPSDVAKLANTGALSEARRWVADARAAGKGVFSANAPQGKLLLEPWELRYLARLGPPDRWVLDLTGNHAGALVPPTRYFEVQYPEDRLFVPREYLDLFKARGWKATSL